SPDCGMPGSSPSSPHPATTSEAARAAAARRVLRRASTRRFPLCVRAGWGLHARATEHRGRAARSTNRRRYCPRAMAEGTLRVAQLNAGSLLEPGWDERREIVVAWLRHLDPDVVCLQEVWQDGGTPNPAGWLVEHMPEAGWHWQFGGGPFGPAFWPDPELSFGSAILSRWPIDAHAYHR